ncbi:hypothetical protein F6X40_23980 [Paraburkholderia sp. UCT31]|uniref:hypothetical protein n=1 Tax=Paraburkholderia sp. UCT31 TaxID=2615209 RepID=UPI001655FE7E|nr:hypothetical protein [Paraburkholderia sp. UCT31]MBC8739776.1 hypothetical protein [Paraburkholderia sp. UCT31]
MAVALWASRKACADAHTATGYPVAHTGASAGGEPCILGYLFRAHDGALYDQNGMLPKQIWDPARFKEQRRLAWLAHVDLWREQHGLTREQALSVLNDNAKPIRITSLFGWLEMNDFLAASISPNSEPAD